MFGKHQNLKEVNWERICQVIGEQRFKEVVARSRLLGIVNWTMLPHLGGIWQKLADDILPSLKDPSGGRRLVFIDLADPGKRTVEDLRGALRLCTALQRDADVILGLNLKEAVQVAGALGADAATDPEGVIEALAQTIRERLQLATVVLTRAAARQQPAGTEARSMRPRWSARSSPTRGFRPAPATSSTRAFASAAWRAYRWTRPC